MKVHDWGTVPLEQMSPKVARQVIHGRHITLARVQLGKGGSVGEHRHPNEQITTLERGKLRFLVGGAELVLEPGQMLEIPPQVPHSVEALEDSVAVDLFSPVREDWIRGEDAYLRGG